MNKTVCILLADGFEEVEAIFPADILKRLNINVILAGIKGTNICGAHGICLTTQTTINEFFLKNSCKIAPIFKRYKKACPVCVWHACLYFFIHF